MAAETSWFRITTISDFGWPSMRPLLEGLLDHDDEQVREEAAFLLGAFDEVSPQI